jgi:hypothetical protein
MTTKHLLKYLESASEEEQFIFLDLLGMVTTEWDKGYKFCLNYPGGKVSRSTHYRRSKVLKDKMKQLLEEK